MKRSIPEHVKLKAAGGMRDLDTAIRFIEIGCDRLGTSKTEEILDALTRRLDLPSRRAIDARVSLGTPGSTTGPGTSY